MERTELIEFLRQKYHGKDVNIKLYTQANSVMYRANWLKNKHVIKCAEEAGDPEVTFRAAYKGTRTTYVLVGSPA